ncbi:MAG TPA: molecular chaperone [Lachnospiraceae bacterium]|nr:molecular chaperone [Lachnospiraceae bacterium]
MTRQAAVFQRYEKKYLLDMEQYEGFRKAIDGYMQVDEYGKSTICNIYYDTEHYDLIRASIEKPPYKEKLRLRSYGVPELSDMVFLEVKKKCQGIVYKRRIALPLYEAYESLERGFLAGDKGQIGRELNYFIKRYHPVPKLFLAYDRIAMFGTEDDELRMTFDFSVRSREEDLDLAKGDSGELLLEEEKVILEVKVRDAYPFWLIQALEQFAVYPGSFSKYGNVYKKILLPEFLTETFHSLPAKAFKIKKGRV